MEKLKITRLPVKAYYPSVNGFSDLKDTFTICPINSDDVIAKIQIRNNELVEAESTALLFEETINVANETGKTPRRLAEENKALVDILTRVVNQMNNEHLSEDFGAPIIAEANEFLIGKQTSDWIDKNL